MDETVRKRIGFDRTIALEWLDAALARALTGEAPEESAKALWEFLDGIEPGATLQSSRGKTLTVLNRVWISVPEPAKPLKQAALRAVGGTSGETRIAVHWAMVVGTHPFFFDVATHVGQLTKLHGQVNRSQLKRRMAETWGERSTVERAILRVVQSMEQWGVLRPGEDKGSVIGSGHRIAVKGELGQLLVHAVLLCSGRGLLFSKLAEHPALFPFSVQLTARELMASPVFLVQRQGDQLDLVDLAQPRPGPWG